MPPPRHTEIGTVLLPTSSRHIYIIGFPNFTFIPGLSINMTKYPEMFHITSKIDSFLVHNKHIPQMSTKCAGNFLTMLVKHTAAVNTVVTVPPLNVAEAIINDRTVLIPAFTVLL